MPLHQQSMLLLPVELLQEHQDQGDHLNTHTHTHTQTICVYPNLDILQIISLNSARPHVHLYTVVDSLFYLKLWHSCSLHCLVFIMIWIEFSKQKSMYVLASLSMFRHEYYHNNLCINTTKYIPATLYDIIHACMHGSIHVCR